MTTEWRGAALVTGAAGGIGKATCTLLASSGWQVVAADRDAAKLKWTEDAADISGEIVDVSQPEDNARMIDAAVQRFGKLDAVILNAALSLNGGIEDFAMSEFDRMIAVNLRGVVLGIRAAIPALRRNGGGSIVVTSSTHGLAGDPGFWAYAATKHGLIGVVKSVARELGCENIRINAVCPGPTRATGLSTDIEQQAPDAYRMISSAVPLQRWGEPAEIAAVIAFLASPAASYVNGIAMPVDGGTLAGSGCLPPTSLPTMNKG